jgi:hypothetical protein
LNSTHNESSVALINGMTGDRLLRKDVTGTTPTQPVNDNKERNW